MIAFLAGGNVARAADECKGLQTCLPVPGPWVAIPASTPGAASTVSWQLRCPLRGYIVAGIDARVSDRAIDISIRGENGAPVSPGVTTGREVVHRGLRWCRLAPDPFRPFIGCILTSVTRRDCIPPPGGLCRQGRSTAASCRSGRLGRDRARRRRLSAWGRASSGRATPTRSAPRPSRSHAPPRGDRTSRRDRAPRGGDRHGGAERSFPRARRAPAPQPLLEGNAMSFEASSLSRCSWCLWQPSATGFSSGARRAMPSATRTSRCLRASRAVVCLAPPRRPR